MRSLPIPGNPQRCDGPLQGVRHHPKKEPNADGRDHHRQQEHDPKEALSAEVLRDEQGEAQSEQELNDDANKDKVIVTTSVPGRPPLK